MLKVGDLVKFSNKYLILFKTSPSYLEKKKRIGIIVRVDKFKYFSHPNNKRANDKRVLIQYKIFWINDGRCGVLREPWIEKISK